MTDTRIDDPLTAYDTAWREEDPRARMALLETAWASDAIYCDPVDHVVGRAALSAHIEGTQRMLAGGTVKVTTSPVRHHDSAFFRWAIEDRHGATVLTGFDVVQLDPSGRIARLTGFFDRDTAAPGAEEAAD